MSAVAYSIAGIVIGLGAILAGGIVGGLWFAVNSMRPELLRKHSAEGD